VSLALLTLTPTPTQAPDTHAFASTEVAQKVKDGPSLYPETDPAIRSDEAQHRGVCEVSESRTTRPNKSGGS
jgi:hypothetical protein